MRNPPSRVPIAGILLVLALLPSACRDHHPTAPPPSGAGALDGLWPNDDGMGWTYRTEQRTFESTDTVTTYSSADQVPPAPSMSRVQALLGTPYPGAVSLRDTMTYILRFQGLLTTASGATGQNLTETVIRPGVGAVALEGRRALLERLWLARPDLRPRLRARCSFAASPADTVHLRPGILLHGYAWEKTSAWIGTYGDLNTSRAWTFLTSALAPGSEFTLQLVPELADDLFLHGRILPRRTITTPAGTFANAVVCAYLVDYGVVEVVDQSHPASLGWSRIYDYGSIAYVSGVGPVACYERRSVSPGTEGAGDLTHLLTSYDGGAPFARAGGR